MKPCCNDPSALCDCPDRCSKIIKPHSRSDVDVIGEWYDLCEWAKQLQLYIVFDEYTGFEVRRIGSDPHELPLGKCTTFLELIEILRSSR